MKSLPLISLHFPGVPFTNLVVLCLLSGSSSPLYLKIRVYPSLVLKPLPILTTLVISAYLRTLFYLATKLAGS